MKKSTIIILVIVAAVAIWAISAYNSLVKMFPQEAKELFAKTEQYAKLRYEGYKRLSEEK